MSKIINKNNKMKQLEEMFKNYDNNTTPSFSLNGQKMWGRVVSLYDGDTLTIALNVFTGIYKFSVRMSGIDTCEIKSKNDKNKEMACNARSRLLSLVTGKDVSEMTPLNDRKKINLYLNKGMYFVWVECQDFDKYGRLLANIYKDENDQPENSFSAILIRDKLAYEYKGDTKLTEDEQMECLKQ
jgi:endonuclease YncB( thermonuclease family)|uniref:TNase-like domain-containing protein n=1 Tax=viral metagenome TaxID=1070528 RepID=A0A6C0I740_9ZZZZ